jgi:hypothetical protein
LKSVALLMGFPGLWGIAVGIGLFFIVWLIAELGERREAFDFDPHGETGAFEPLLANYLDIAKVVIGLASGSIVLLVGSTAFHSAGRLPASFASPLFLLALSILYGVFFMAFMMLHYEAYRHRKGNSTYSGRRYALNRAFGFSCLLCFCIGYLWLIVSVMR